MNRLLLVGLASIVLYCFGITARYPLMVGLQEPRGSWATTVGASWEALGAHVGVYAALTVCYVLALTSALTLRDTAHVRHRIVGVWLLCALVLLGAYPGGESHDLFDYLFRGRMMAEFGVSPLAVTPDLFRRSPYYLYISWHAHVDTYGPLWEYTSATIAASVRGALQLAGWWSNGLPTCPSGPESCHMLIAYITGYRILAIGLAGVSGALIYRMVRRAPPPQGPAAPVASVSDPGLLVGTPPGAHKDSLMIALLLLALSLFQHRRWLLGLLVVGLAAHVKLTALLLAPVIGIWLVRQIGWRHAIGLALVTCAILLPLSWLLYAPLGGWATLPRMLNERGLFLAGSPAHVFYRWLHHIQGWEATDARELLTRSATLLFAGIAAVLVGRLYHAPHQADESSLLWRAAATITLAYLLIGSFWFQHWYILWVLAPAALLPHMAITRIFVPWYGFGALAANVVGNMAGTVIEPMPNRFILAAIDVTVILGPLLLALLGVTLQQVRHRQAIRPQIGRAHV